MKKLVLLVLLSGIVIVTGCSNKTTNSTSTGSMDAGKTGSAAMTDKPVASIDGKYVFEDENCNKYVKLMECLIDKTPDAAKNQTITSFTKVMELWKGLEKSVLPSTCKNTIDMLSNQKDVFEKAGCSL